LIPPTLVEEVETTDPGQEPILDIGNYEDMGLLGAGGMGEVRKIRDRDLNRTLAMKIIHAGLLKKHNVTARFIEEAQICAQLQHPNIVPVHEIGQLDDGRVFFTMKEIKGRPFGKAIKEVHRAVVNDRWQITDSGFPLVQAPIGALPP
jgi:eukaryotic-like serine/threonine-protein kinase